MYKHRYLLRLFFRETKHYETTWINSVDPIKVGDWISVGGYPAHVLKIEKYETLPKTMEPWRYKQ